MDQEEIIVVPESPRHLGTQELFVYVPVATNERKGIASFSQNFKVTNGVVDINFDYLDYIGKSKVLTATNATLTVNPNDSTDVTLNIYVTTTAHSLDINDTLLLRINFPGYVAIATMSKLFDNEIVKLNLYYNDNLIKITTHEKYSTTNMQYATLNDMQRLKTVQLSMGSNLVIIAKCTLISSGVAMLDSTNLSSYMTETDTKSYISMNYYTKTDINTLLSTKANATDLTALTNRVGTLEGYIPADVKSNTDSLATQNFVNSSITTNTANFIGTFANIAERDAYLGTITNNDYCFVTNSEIKYGLTDWPTKNDLDIWTSTHSSSLTNYDYAWVENSSKYDLYRWNLLSEPAAWVKVNDTPIDKADYTPRTAYNRYKYSTNTWRFEYTLNNSSFTSAQWAAINSGIDSSKVAQIETNRINIGSLSNATTNLQLNKQNKSTYTTVTLLSTDWSSNTYTLSVTGKTSTNNARLLIPSLATAQATLDNLQALKTANIYYATESGTDIILTCENTPSVNLYIQVEVF